MVEAIRHTQAAGDWSDAARLLADHSFSLTLDGQAQTIQVLLRAFPPGAPADDPELALVRAADDLLHGRLDEATAHLAVAETYVETTPPDRQRRLAGGDRVAEAVAGAGGAVTWPASSKRPGSLPPRYRGSPTKTSRWAATCARWR